MAKSRKTVAVDVSNAVVWSKLFSSSLRGIMQYASETPGWELLFNAGPLTQRGSFSTYEDLGSRGVDGLIFYGRPDQKSMRRIKSLGFPVVSVGTGATGEFPSVQVASYECGRMAARHLLDRGYRRLAFVGNLALPSIMTRGKGLAETVADAGGFSAWFSIYNVPEGLPVVNVTEASQAGAERLGPAPTETNLRDWLARLPKPVGIIGSSDRRAQHLLNVCKDLGLTVPGDAAVVGVENNELLCESMRPQLSSVDINGRRIGFRAASLLDGLMNGENAPAEPILVPPRNVVTRASSDALAASDRAVRTAVEYIARNLANPIGLSNIVHASGVSRTALERRFHQTLDRTINAELLRQRLDRAKHLMVETDLSLSQIAEISGFKCTYFRNVFADKVGAPPGQWRREHR